jgi:hypothetical protein
MSDRPERWREAARRPLVTAMTVAMASSCGFGSALAAAPRSIGLAHGPTKVAAFGSRAGSRSPRRARRETGQLTAEIGPDRWRSTNTAKR